MAREHRFDSMAALVAELAAGIAHDGREALAARGEASLMVSGGRTPAPLFAALAPRPLDWPKVAVGLVDERWVPPDHADSNERLVRSTLLVQAAAAARFVPMKNGAATASAGQPACEAAIRAMPRPFDVCLLGMGDDGHTASLFPRAPQLAAGLDIARDALTIATDPVTAPHQRMSLTLRALLTSRRIVVQLAGDNKWQVYQQALAAGPVSELPIRAVLRQEEVPVDVYWSR